MSKQVKFVAKKLKEAERPVLLVGNGIRLAGGIDILHRVINKLGITVVSGMFTADDIVTYEYPHYLGCQGMWGRKIANEAVDNCDLLLVI
jgi:acetolactate synthase-1/2/3 large subunit